MNKNILFLLVFLPLFTSGQVLRYGNKAIVAGGKVAIFKQVTTHEFSPLDIDSCVLWLKADAGVTLNGSTVSAWADQSGNGNNAVQNTASYQPTYIADGGDSINHKPVIRFDGVNDVMGIAENIIGNEDDKTIISVFKIITGEYGAIITSTTVDGSSRIKIDPLDNNWGQLTCALKGGQHPSFYIRTNTYYTISARKIDPFIWVNLNGALENYTNIGGDVATNIASTTALGTYRVGDSNFGNFKLAELIVYSNGISDSDRLLLEQYLHDKYQHY